MSKITVLGATGYAGAAICAEAAARRHKVTAVSRRLPSDDRRVDGVAYLSGDAAQPAFLEIAVADSTIVISSLSPRGTMLGQVRRVNSQLISLADRLGFRLGVILGAGSLSVEPGGSLLSQTDGFPDAVKAEADEMAEVLADLRSSPAGVDWFGVSPAAGFGGFEPGEALGVYRVGGDEVLFDSSGRSFISAPDLALAVVDEIERPVHKRTRFTVAY